MDIAAISNQGQVPAPASEPTNTKWLVENQELIRSVKSIDASELFGEGSELSFALDRETRRPVVRVVNPQTGEVLWQSPPEYMLRLAQSLGHHGG